MMARLAMRPWQSFLVLFPSVLFPRCFSGVCWNRLPLMSIVVLMLLVVAVVEMVEGQRTDQTYIIIRPAVLELSEDKPEGAVEVVCRQLPMTSTTVFGQTLELSRKPIEQTPAQLLARIQKGRNVITKSVKASGDVDKELVVVMKVTSCGDSVYTFNCTAVLSNNLANFAVATLTIYTPPPNLAMYVRPQRELYAETDDVFLVCITGKSVVGLKGVRVSWVWEYSDVGAWKSISQSAIQGSAVNTSEDCFQRSEPSFVKVYLNEFQTCSRRYRCYFQRDNISTVENAAESLLDRGYDCQDNVSLLDSDPFVAIVSVLAVMTVICLLTYGLHKQLCKKLMMNKDNREKTIGKHILSPMTLAQRDRLMKEKQEMMREEVEENLESVTNTDGYPSHDSSADLAKSPPSENPMSHPQPSSVEEEDNEEKNSEVKVMESNKDVDDVETIVADPEGESD